MRTHPARSLASTLIIASLLSPLKADQSGGQISTSSEFAVASVKSAQMVHPFNGHVGIRIDAQHGLFGCDHCNLELLLEWIYDIKDFQVSGPPWINSERYAIEARMAPGVAKPQIKQMTERLLEQRFGMKAHFEQKEANVFHMVAGPKGTKLQPSREAASFISGNGSLRANNTSMDDLAQIVSSLINRPVVNMTAIDGRFDISLRWAPGVTPQEDDGVLRSTIQQQLGLLFKAAKTPIRFLVVDQASKIPTPN